MRKLTIAIATVLGSMLFALPNTVFAVDVFGGPDGACTQANTTGEVPEICKDTVNATGESPIVGPNGIVTKGVQVLVIVVGIIAVIMLIISGLRLITSGGDPKNAASARDGILYAGIGIVVVITAQLLINFVLTKL